MEDLMDMEFDLPTASSLGNATLNDAVEHAHTNIGIASTVEILCFLAIPLLALMIGRHVNRFIDQRANKTIGFAMIDFVAPLLSPTLAILFTILALHGLQYFGVKTYLLPFAIKLTIAWFAIHLVIRMSSQQLSGWLIVCFIVPITLLHLFDLWDMTLDTLIGLSFSIGSVQLNAYNILRGVAVIFALQWLASFAVRVTDSRLRNIRGMRASNRALITKIFQIILYCFVFLIGMQLLGISLTALSVFGGALGVGLGFGLQKIASNFISGIILLFEKSVEVGDMIELADGTVGFIRRTNARYTLLETQDGRDVLIPNEEFISQRVISWTHGDKNARVDITLAVDYGSDVALARTLMLDAVGATPKRIKTRPTTCVLNDFRDSGAQLNLQFWVADVSDGRSEPKSDVMLAILKLFKEHDIHIAAPQMRVINTTPQFESKPEKATKQPKEST